MGRPAKFWHKNLQTAPNKSRVINNYACQLMEKKDWETAITELKKAIEIQPNYDDARYNLGTCYMELKKWQECIEELTLSLKINSQMANAHNNLGICIAEGRKDYLTATNEFAEAIRLNPNDESFYRNLKIATMRLQEQKR